MATSSTEEIFLPGFVFELDEPQIVHLLSKKKYGCNCANESIRFIKEIQLYKHEPLELSNLATDSGHKKKYFFTRLEKKYENNKEVIINRQIPGGGSWRITGKSINIEDKDGKPVAKKTPFCYYQTSTAKTQWLMKEYMLLESELPNQNELPSWALCVVYYK